MSRIKTLAWKILANTGATGLMARLLAKLLPASLMKDGKYFPLWERRGYHVIPVHFYQPIPDTRELDDKIWTASSELSGIDMKVPDVVRSVLVDWRMGNEKCVAGNFRIEFLPCVQLRTQHIRTE